MQHIETVSLARSSSQTSVSVLLLLLLLWQAKQPPEYNCVVCAAYYTADHSHLVYQFTSETTEVY